MFTMENICRTCLRAPGNLIPIQINDGLIHKIEKISSIQLSFNEYYPSSICEECFNNVNKFYSFQKVIVSNDKDLRARYDTLKKTNFTSKPRTKEEEPEEDDSTVKEEVDLDIDDFEGGTLSTAEVVEVINSIATDDNVKVDKNNIKQFKVDSVRKVIAKLNLAKCDECNTTFSSRIKLHNHRRTAHMAPGICNICGMIIRADNLRRHIQMHSEGPAKCDICQKVFKNPESLRGHKLIHQGLEFTCEICGKTSRVKSEHRRHVKSHTDPDCRKVMCTVCGKRVRSLKKHMQTHTGERPHKCSYCKKGFTSTHALKIHTRQHTNERPFVCEFCNMGFPQKVSLMTHLKSKHDAILS